MNMQEALNILRPQGSMEEDLKQAYRSACKTYHPDVNPNGLELMKLINLAYEFLQTNLNKWSFEQVNQDKPISDIFEEILNKIKHFPGIAIEVCGTWLWVSGSTKTYKSELKAAGLRWANKKRQWYWRPEGYHKRGKREFSMDEIRLKYGSESVDNEPFEAMP